MLHPSRTLQITNLFGLLWKPETQLAQQFALPLQGELEAQDPQLLTGHCKRRAVRCCISTQGLGNSRADAQATW